MEHEVIRSLPAWRPAVTAIAAALHADVSVNVAQMIRGEWLRLIERPLGG